MPLAPITDQAYFNVEIDGTVVGRITFGLYGETVPKTVKNFVEICKGGHMVPKRHHSRQKGGAFKMLDDFEFYITELLKINPIQFFRDPVSTMMNFLTKVMVGRP